MKSELIVDVGVQKSRVALLEDNELVEIYIEGTGLERTAGNIYRGRVSNVLPGMQAAFVDIGFGKNAFLYVGDVSADRSFFANGLNGARKKKKLNIDDLLKPGQEITVQVVKESAGSKGARITTNIALPGRHLVLLPFSDYTGISRRIEDERERAKLKVIAEKLKPKGMGLIVRTASEGKEEGDFIHDLSSLLKLWKSIKQKERKGPVPRCVHKDLNLVNRTVRDLFTTEINRLVINSREHYEEILANIDMISPALRKRVEYYDKKSDIFEHYRLKSSLKRALSRKIQLKCGGYLVIDKTEALTVIDVNTGKYVGKRSLEHTVLKANIEAAREVARQIRLRDIGGIIIIDFIDMHEHGHQQEVLATLKEMLKKDRTKTAVVGMTGLGLIEMTRKKVRQELSEVLGTKCPYCDGTGEVP